MKKTALIITILLYCLPVYGQTDYDAGQDRYVDGLIAGLKETVKDLKNENKELIEVNATQEVKVNILMGFAGFLVLALAYACWHILKKHKSINPLVVSILILSSLLLVGCAGKPKALEVCQTCLSVQCFEHWQCRNYGCSYCETRRGVVYPFRCR